MTITADELHTAGLDLGDHLTVASNGRWQLTEGPRRIELDDDNTPTLIHYAQHGTTWRLQGAVPVDDEASLLHAALRWQQEARRATTRP